MHVLNAIHKINIQHFIKITIFIAIMFFRHVNTLKRLFILILSFNIN